MNSQFRLLVVSFYFPPYKRVGGRRWAKHLKYLHRDGIHFKVLAGDFSNMTSPWDKDITDYKGDISRIPINDLRPYFKKSLPTNLFQKIRWKISLALWTIIKGTSKHDLSDVSRNYHTAFLQKVKLLIDSHQISTIVLSVGPYDYSQLLIRLRTLYPALGLYIDFRDPWKNNYDPLTERIKKNELIKKHKVLDAVDGIITVNQELVDYYKHFNPKKNIILLPHAFDPEDIPDLPPVDKNKGTIKLCYGGSLYSGNEGLISQIVSLTNKISKHSRIQTNFYVSMKGYEKELNHPNVNVQRSYLDSDEYFNKVRQANYALLILPENRNNAMSSKFFELIALRRPILYFGGKGLVSSFLEEHNIGIHVTDNNIQKIANQIITNNIEIDMKFDLSSYTFKYQNKILLTHLKKNLSP